MESENIFDLMPTDLSAEVFNTLVGTDNIKIERIVSKGHVSPKQGWYDQQQNEWVIVLQGGASIEIEDKGVIDLQPGGYINIPSRTKHRVTWTDENIETVWLAVHY